MLLFLFEISNIKTNKKVVILMVNYISNKTYKIVISLT